MTDHDDEGSERSAPSEAPEGSEADLNADSAPSEAPEGSEADLNADGAPSGAQAHPAKRTSLNWKSAALPVAITLLLSVFIVYPYVRNIQLFGAQKIAAADDKGIKLTNEGARLLGGIREGAALDGCQGTPCSQFQVEHLRGPIRDRLEVELERGGQRVRVFVSRQDRVSFEPPRKTLMYALHYENAKPNADAVTSEEYLALVEAVAKVVEQHERQVSMPKGL